MKKTGILNPQLSRIVATMGHTDKLVVCDSGLPIPPGAEVVQLALTKNIPRFVETVKALLEEMEVQGAIVATEMPQKSQPLFKELEGLLPGVKIQMVPHEEFKRLTCNGVSGFVRTGECTPYANVILVSGVTFG